MSRSISELVALLHAWHAGCLHHAMRHFHRTRWLAAMLGVLLPAASARAQSYEYDGASRLARVTTGSSTVEYRYDGEGRLVQRRVNGTILELIQGGDRVVGESNGSVFAYGPTGLSSSRKSGYPSGIASPDDATVPVAA